MPRRRKTKRASRRPPGSAGAEFGLAREAFEAHGTQVEQAFQAALAALERMQDNAYSPRAASVLLGARTDLMKLLRRLQRLLDSFG